MIMVVEDSSALLSVLRLLSQSQFIAAGLLVIPIVTYLLTSVQPRLSYLAAGEAKSPPTVPYCFPLVGNLIAFASNPAKFASYIVNRFGNNDPVTVRLGLFTAYFISNADHFETILKGARNLNSSSGIIMTLQNLFDLPARAAKFMHADNSGLAATPLPGSNIAPHDRIGHLRHSAAMRLLYGPHLTGLTTRFVQSLAKHISEDGSIGAATTATDDGWVELPDLVRFLKIKVLTAATSSICGPHFFRLNPHFAEDFWAFYDDVPTFIKGLPKWWNPGAQAARARCLDSITRWHKYAWSHMDHEQVERDDPDWEEFFGAKIMRTRYSYGIRMGEMDDKARAAEDLAMLFAVNANSVPATVFFILELLRDPVLYRRTMKELDSARLPEVHAAATASATSSTVSSPTKGGNDGHGSGNQVSLFDVSKLTASPLMQSVYAETLRLRMAMALMRAPEKSDFLLDGWRFTKDKLIFLLTSTAAHNSDLWNAGTPKDPHPLSEFWADRFLIRPGDEESGPLRKERRQSQAFSAQEGGMQQAERTRAAAVESTCEASDAEPKFSMDGLAGGWIPYGGGNRMCPGRFFAKNEMIVSFAMFSDTYEIELLTPPSWKPRPDMKYFAAGVMPPKDKVPCRIRRRRKNNES